MIEFDTLSLLFS